MYIHSNKTPRDFIFLSIRTTYCVQNHGGPLKVLHSELYQSPIIIGTIHLLFSRFVKLWLLNVNGGSKFTAINNYEYMLVAYYIMYIHSNKTPQDLSFYPMYNFL